MDHKHSHIKHHVPRVSLRLLNKINHKESEKCRMLHSILTTIHKLQQSQQNKRGTNSIDSVVLIVYYENGMPN